MSRTPRLVGYAMMAAALLLAWVQRGGAFDTWRAGAATALILTVAAVGVMLVFTDLMVRSLYAQLDAAPPPADPPSNGEGLD